MAEDPNDLQERQRLYERTRDELAATARSISESYDRALLTLSSAFLGGSLAFVGQVVDLPTASAKWVLYLAWLLFALAMVLTLASFIYGLHTLQPLRNAAERYYMRREQDAWKVSERVQRVVLRYVVACGASFLLGVVLLGAFIVVNSSKETAMSQKSSSPKVSQKSIPVATFQKPVPQAPASTGGGGTAQSMPKTPTTQNQQGSK
jgi:hypothetical protein